MPHRPKSRGPVVILLGVPLLLVGYVLSIGPAYVAVAKTGSALMVYKVAYAPLFLACDCIQTLDVWLRWYCRWCYERMAGP